MNKNIGAFFSDIFKATVEQNNFAMYYTVTQF